MKKDVRRGPGRPPVENAKTVRLEIRVTPAERITVGKHARARGKTISDYVRGLLKLPIRG